MKKRRGKMISVVAALCLAVQVFACCGMEASAQETDEVVIEAVEYGADPTGERDSALAVWQAFLAAKEATEGGAKSVTVHFPKGEYHIYKDYAQQREYHTSNTNSIENPIKTVGLLIEGQENFTLDGDGSLFMMHGNMMALAVVDSQNVTLKDFSWDFGVPTVTELTVTGMGEEDGKEYTDFLIPECFPHEISGNTLLWHSEKSPYTKEYYWTQAGHHSPTYAVVAYQPEGEMSRSYFEYDGPFNGVAGIEELDETHIRIRYASSRPSMQKVGTVIELAANAHRETAGAFTWESENVTARNVNVHFMHGFGWLIQMSRDVYYYDCSLKPREGSGHITVSFADGIHASGAAGDLVIEGCDFSDTHDDPINLHGTFTRVEKRIDAHTLQLKYIHAQQGGFPQYHVGDQAAFFTRDTLESKDGEALYTVEEVVSNPGEDGNDLRTMVVRFQEELPVHLSDKIGNEPKFVAENVTYAPKVTIRDCTFGRSPARGILCTTRNPVLIEGNLFQGMSMATIFLSNDSNEWYESGPIRDMTIRNNEFHIKTIGRTSWEYAPAIYVHPVTKGGGLPGEDNPIHKNITIEGNVFYMDTDTVVKAESVESLTIKNNVILRENPDISLELSASQTSLLVGDTLTMETLADGKTQERPQDNVYEFTKCKNVVLEGNSYDDGLKRYAVLSGMSDENLTNQDSDIKTAYDRDQPVSAPVQGIGYVSANPEILTVDENGRVYAKKAGKAAVSAYYLWNGEKILSKPVELTVLDKSAVKPEDTVKLEGREDAVLTKAGETLAFSAKTESGKEIAWSVEDFLTGGETDAAVIDENGVLTAKENGIVWVKARAGVSTSRLAVVISIPVAERSKELSVVREAASEYTLAKDKITAVMMPGDLYESSNSVKNLFLYQVPAECKDNLRAVIKIENMPEREAGQWDTASFLLYQDDDNYISVGKKSHYDGFVTVEETNAAATETGGDAAQNSLTDAYLGFYKKGSQVSVDYKEEGGEWRHIRDLPASMLKDGYQVAFAAWVTNERGKEVAFSDFHIGVGDISYDQLCEQPFVSFLGGENHAPLAHGAAFDKKEYKVGDVAAVTYSFEDEDGDAEGRTLYCFSYENGVKEVADQPSIKLAYPGAVVCEVYPADEKGMPGKKAMTAKAIVNPEEKEPPKKDEDISGGGNLTPSIPAKGTLIQSGGVRYRITKSDAKKGTAVAEKLISQKKARVKIPATVQKDGYSFRVTAIGSQAFLNAKKLEEVTVGENVSKIGKKSFYQCPKLRSVIFKGKKAPGIGKGAFQKIAKKCKVTVRKKMPAKQLQKLKKEMKRAGKGIRFSYKKK